MTHFIVAGAALMGALTIEACLPVLWARTSSRVGQATARALRRTHRKLVRCRRTQRRSAWSRLSGRTGPGVLRPLRCSWRATG